MTTLKAATEPFNAQRQSQIDCAEYQFGFHAAMRGDLNNTSQTLAWHRGWASAEEWLTTATYIPASQ